MTAYREDLAYIHDLGFGDYALQSAPGILEILAQNQIHEGLVVDLGCGSGLSAQELIKAHYRVIGVDISESMLDIARTRVPDAEFVLGSIFQVPIPPCNAVISIGECLNYLLKPSDSNHNLTQLFRRIYNALNSGGVFIFDIAEPGQVKEGTTVKGFTEGDDWLVLVEKEENYQQSRLTRRIITFRQVGKYYRRDEEVHYQQLYKATDIEAELQQVGFQVKTLRNYGQYNLPPAHAAFIASKAIAEGAEEEEYNFY